MLTNREDSYWKEIFMQDPSLNLPPLGEYKYWYLLVRFGPYRKLTVMVMMMMQCTVTASTCGGV